MDFAFRTYMQPTTQIPEPPVLVLLTVGLLAMSGLALVRTRTRALPAVARSTHVAR